MTADFETLLGALTEAEVEFVIIGGLSLVIHGSSRITRDLDISYSRSQDNLERIEEALAPFVPTLRGAPANLPFVLDAPTLKSGLNFTLSSRAGDIDLLGEVSGLGGYEIVKRFSEPTTLYGRSVQVLSLAGLERAKRAAGRLRDVMDLADILELRRQTEKREK